MTRVTRPDGELSFLNDQQVTYYDPFRHYVLADCFRVFILAAALVTAGMVAILAVQRWSEERRSASVFLGALLLSMVVHVSASIVTLGRPPTWWLLWLRFGVIVLSFAGCLLAIWEAKRGVWARRT